MVEEKRSARYKRNATQKDIDRLNRALSQRLYLIEEKDISNTEESFHFLGRRYDVLGSTGNVYNVLISKFPSCSCPDFTGKNHVCKHLFFVMIKVLHEPKTSLLVYQKALLQSELENLFNRSSIRKKSDVLANTKVIEAYKSLTNNSSSSNNKTEDSNLLIDLTGDEEVIISPQKNALKKEIKEDDDCPICFEPLLGNSNEKLEQCFTCHNYAHADCMNRWFASNKSSGIKEKKCCYCRYIIY